jgi:hypothetical protein
MREARNCLFCLSEANKCMKEAKEAAFFCLRRQVNSPGDFAEISQILRFLFFKKCLHNDGEI